MKLSIKVGNHHSFAVVCCNAWKRCLSQFSSDYDVTPTGPVSKVVKAMKSDGSLKGESKNTGDMGATCTVTAKEGALTIASNQVL